MQVQGLSDQLRGHGADISRRKHLGHREITSRAWPRPLGIIAVALALTACSTMDGLGFPPASAAEPQSTVQTAAADVQTSPVAPTNSKFGPTAVGQKAAQLRTDFDKLRTNTQTRSQQLETIRNQTVSNVNSYHSRVGAIRSRLQMGSTPGNPELLAEWNQAQSQLTQIDADIATLNQLSAAVSSDAGQSAFILGCLALADIGHGAQDTQRFSIAVAL